MSKGVILVKVVLFMAVLLTETYAQKSKGVTHQNIDLNIMRNTNENNLANEDLCTNVTCQNGGVCNITGETFECLCPKYFYGKFCENCKCENGRCSEDLYKNVICECLPGFAKQYSTCIDCDCGKAANCTFEKRFLFWFDKFCICPKGERPAKDLRCRDYCKSVKCKNGGSCEFIEKDFRCLCPKSYSGKNCEIELTRLSTESSTNGLHRNSSTTLYTETSTSEPTHTDASTSRITKDLTWPIISTSETVKTEMSTSKPITTSVTKDHCRTDNDCRNGGACRLRKGRYSCLCKKPFTGNRCEKNKVCEPMEASCAIIGATCNFIEWLEKGVCECPPSQAYDRELKMCRDICTSESCIHGKCDVERYRPICRCSEGFEGYRCDKIKSKDYGIESYIVISAGLLVAVIFAFACTSTTVFVFFKRLKKLKN